MSFRVVATTIMMCLCTFSAHAENAAPGPQYPNKPITLIVGYSPGGSNDVVARLLARELQKRMGQPVVVENRPSTGAIVGAIATANAKPDGYTLMIAASGPIVINPAVYKKLPYSPQKNFDPISLVATFPLVLSVKGDAPIKSAKELIAYTKAHPNQANYSASSSAFQLASELLKERTGMVAQHIPYKGSNDSAMAVASGEVTFSLLDPGPAAGAIRGGLIRGIAVTSAERMSVYPEIPTLKEQGIDMQIGFWIGLFAPAGTPPTIIKRLEQETATAISNVDMAKDMTQMGLIPTSSSPEEFAQQIGDEIAMWSALAKQNNISVE